jgi:hypothetical protein
MVRCTVVVLGLLLCPSLGRAQQVEPLPVPREPKPKFVFDARIGAPGLDKDATVAAALAVAPDDLPGRGLGVLLGGHFYAARARTVSLGIGGEMLWSRASHSVQPLQQGDPEGPVLKTRWSNISPQVSLNFGGPDGWSYLTGGLGWSKLTMEREDDPQESGGRVRSLNYGGGARWFINHHFAVNMDLRFYSIGAQEAATGRVPTPKMRVLLLTGGISLR